jgi:hypothetical protein
MPSKGQTHPFKGTQRPHVWITGPDPLLHTQYLAWLQQRNQAQWRKEGWHIPFNEWLEMWKLQWHNRGRRPENVCMVRTDYDLPWTRDNVEIIPRTEHSKRHNQRQFALGKTRGYKQRINKNENTTTTGSRAME